MVEAAPTVFVVDDDISVRESLELLIRKQGWRPETFTSAQEFLARPQLLAPSCLVLDFSLPGLNGLELQKRVAVERHYMPIIFITGFGNIPMSVEAMKAGAVEFLTKPFTNESLLGAIRNAIERSRAKLENVTQIQTLKEHYSALTMRERQVMGLLVSGMLNKQVGDELGIYRNHSEIPPREPDEEDGSRLVRGTRKHGRTASDKRISSRKSSGRPMSFYTKLQMSFLLWRNN
jgi:FixJ family two-component response regulator